MSEENKTAVEVVGAEATHPAKMEFRLINPTEDGFLRKINWNKEELEAAVREKIAAYENVVYTEDNMKQAKSDRAELNKLVEAIEDRRKLVKKKINEPYDVFEKELKEILALIKEPVGIIDAQVKAFEDQQKEEKKKEIKAAYDEVIGDLAEVLPFEKVFDIRYLNKTYKLGTAQTEIKEKVQKVRTDLETIDSLESKYKLNAKDVYIKTLDLSKALAENKRLSDLEEKLEAENRRKAEEEAERKRREEEEKAKAEAERKTQEAARQKEETPIQRGCITGKNPYGTCPCCGNGGTVQCCAQCEERCNGRCGWYDMESKAEDATEPVSEMGKVIQGIEQQAFAQAVDPFAAAEPLVPKKEEKKFKTRFYAVATREKLEQLIKFMDDNGIKYGRIN